MLPEGFSIGPGGAHADDAVFQIPSSDSVSLGADGSVHQVGESGDRTQLDVSSAGDPPATRTEPGWVSYARWVSDEAATGLTTRWQVPGAPATNNDQVLFLLSGLQTTGDSSTVFLGTVLQWGRTVFGGGNLWGIACWAQMGMHLIKSSFAVVSAGDEVVANITSEAAGSGQLWRCQLAAGGLSVGLKVTLSGSTELCQVFPAVLEAYAEDMQCSDYPSSDATTFNGIQVAGSGGVLTPDWQVYNPVQDCGQETSIVDTSRITISYRGASS